MSKQKALRKDLLLYCDAKSSGTSSDSERNDLSCVEEERREKKNGKTVSLRQHGTSTASEQPGYEAKQK